MLCATSNQLLMASSEPYMNILPNKHSRSNRNSANASTERKSHVLEHAVCGRNARIIVSDMKKNAGQAASGDGRLSHKARYTTN
jgi:hypothetical protein